jgi:hypothetical protein
VSESTDTLFDLAIGIGPDGAVASAEQSAAARQQLLAAGACLPADIETFRQWREQELIRDDTGRIRGCSTLGCTRPAAWQRVFEKTPNPGRMLLDTVSAVSIGAAIVGAAPVFMLHRGPVDFGGCRIGESVRDNLLIATQYGCWAHIVDFVSIPSSNGRNLFSIMEATLPKQAPHPVFGITDELWKKLLLAMEAQNMGPPEGSRQFCSNCGLPHCPITMKGLKSGEDDDYWRTFCAYCNHEIKPDES